VFVKPPTGWQDATPTATLRLADIVDNNTTVAISGNTIVAGAPFVNQSGAAYVFVEPPGGWQDMTQTAALTLSINFTEEMGTSVAVVGNVVAAGAAGFHWQDQAGRGLRLCEAARRIFR
jgi:FG-GAP repeat